jgi:oligopeptide transport system ATP-binding protein
MAESFLSLTQPLIEVSHLSKWFSVTKGSLFRRALVRVHAVNDVSFSIDSNQTVALVGESGSGKTTIGSIVASLMGPSSGTVFFEGKDLSKMTKQEIQGFRQRVGIVFQDPFASLNPRMTVREVIAEPLDVAHRGSKADRQKRVEELLARVGLSRNDAPKYPHQFSGGQLQRIAMARALALNPVLVVADEPVSSLDVSVQAKILNLMRDIQKEFGLSYLLISHDLGAVRSIADKVVVLYLGFVMEEGQTESIFPSARHPYTRALLSAVLVPNVEEVRRNPPSLLKGEIPSPMNLPNGCKFNARCPYVQDRCRNEQPELVQARTPDHLVSCFFWKELFG